MFLKLWLSQHAITQSLQLWPRAAPPLKCHARTVLKSTSFSPNMANQVFNVNCRELWLYWATYIEFICICLYKICLYKINKYKIKILLWQLIVNISQNLYLEEISVISHLTIKSHRLSILGSILHPLLSMATLLTSLEPGFHHPVSQSKR